MPELEAAGVEPAAGSPRPSPYQPLTWDVRPERRYAISHVVFPGHVVCDFLSDTSPEFVRAATIAACEAWEA